MKSKRNKPLLMIYRVGENEEVRRLVYGVGVARIIRDNLTIPDGKLVYSSFELYRAYINRGHVIPLSKIENW